MKNTCLFLVRLAAVLAAGWPSLPAWAQDAEPAPRLVCDDTVHDFGRADSGTSVTNTFVLKNEGDAPLEITKVHPGCGCTTAKLTETTVQPGAEVGLKTFLSLAGRRGGQRKYVIVESNDPKQPSVTLWMQGLAYEPLTVIPEEIYFGLLQTSAEQTHSFVVRAAADEIMLVTNVVSDTEHLSAAIETLKQGREYRINVTTVPPFPEGRSLHTLTVETDSTNFPAIKMPVQLYSDMGEIQIAPRQLDLPDTKGKEITRQVLVGAPGLESFKIKMVKTPDPTIRFMISRLKPNAYRVQLKNVVPGPDLDGKEVHILTDLEGYEDIVIPVTFGAAP